jgi:hypothetical protein
MIHPKKSIVNPTFKFPAAKVNATLRSFMPLLVLPLLLISAPDAFPAQAPALTWQQVLTNLFGRRSQRGGSRGERPICSVTPIVGNNPISPMSIGQFRKSKPNLVLNEKPLIAWYGRVGAIKIRDTVTGEEWMRFTPKSTAGLNQVQYEGEALKSDRAYELHYISNKNFKTVLNPIERFQILNAVDRANVNAALAALALTGSSQDLVLQQVNILLKNNLPNDAQALLLQQTSPTAALKEAIAAYPDPCIEVSKPSSVPETNGLP